MLQKLGQIVFLKRKWVLSLWIVLILVFVFFALKLPTVLSGNGFEYHGQYVKTQKILENDFGQPKSTIILLFHKKNSIPNSEWRAFIKETFHRLRSFSATTPFDQTGMMKGNYAYGTITFNKDPENLQKETAKIHKLLRNHKGLSVTMTGEPVIVQDLNKASQKDLAKAEMIGLPIALIILILAFGGILAATVPLITGIISIMTTMGIVYFYSYMTHLSIFVLNIIPMIGLALSIDFALLLINRFKEEIEKQTVEEAVKTTVATAGRSIIFSGLCVFIGLSGLLFIKIDIFQNVALGGMTVVFISALSATTFLPALLSIMGKKINYLSLFHTKENHHLWHQFAKGVMKSPIIMTIIALGILLTGLIPAKNMILSIPGTDSLPAKYSSRLAYETFKTEFIPSNRKEEKKVTIILETKGDIFEKGNLKIVNDLIQKLSKDSLVHEVISPFSLTGINDPNKLSYFLTINRPNHDSLFKHFVHHNKMLIQVYLKTGVNSARARDWVQKWSQQHYSVRTYFDGQVKFEQEIFTEIYEKAPYGLFLIFLTTFFILMIAFQSLLIPIKAILMNMLSLSCTFGMLVWIFQEGHLGIKPVDIALILPVFVFTLVFGLSMDYEVFLISRIQEFYLKTGDNSLATVLGLTYTSKIITSAAAIMIVVTGSFAFTGVMPIKQLGVGIAIAIFIDSTIVRMILVPALMKLLGHWNWWFFGFHKKRKPA